MHICRNASRTFYFKRMQGKSRFENSKRLFILPTLWGFFTDAQTIFFSFNHMEVLQIFSSHFYHRLETLFFVHSFLYSTDSSWALSMRLRHGARNKVARHLGGWDYMLWILTTHLTSCLSSVAHSKGSQRRKWQPTPVFLPGEFHGQSSLAGYSPRGHKESDTTEWLSKYRKIFDSENFSHWQGKQSWLMPL